MCIYIYVYIYYVYIYIMCIYIYIDIYPVQSSVIQVFGHGEKNDQILSITQ